VDDGHFALKLVGSELESILNADGIKVVNYSRKTSKLFDVLPALDLTDGKTKQAAPALMRGDKVLRRGTVWQA
jgi:arsenate reductase-like glutaredoxin family protein